MRPSTSVTVSLVIDCSEPDRLVRFWQELLGGSVNEQTRSSTWVMLEGVPSLGYLGFQKVPESKAVKNRVHIDLVVPELAESVRRAVGHGGRLSGSVVEEPTNWFQVMQDPEGNEFCFVQFK